MEEKIEGISKYEIERQKRKVFFDDLEKITNELERLIRLANDDPYLIGPPTDDRIEFAYRILRGTSREE